MNDSSICINGKFGAQRMTGVQRVATCLVHALDEQLAGSPRRWILLQPPGTPLLALRNIAQRTVGWPGMQLHVWEQLVLPAAARGRLLLNLAGSAPYLGSRQVVTLHDAAVFDHPEAYTALFGRWYRHLFRRLAGTAEHVFTVSAFSRTRLVSHLPQLVDRPLTVLAAGADHLTNVAPDDAVLDRHDLRDKRILLAVASANPTKNLPLLVAAFKVLPDLDLRLVIVGGRHERVFSDAAAGAESARVVRTGPLEDAALVALYRRATALVFPSIYEGFGLPPLEAMTMGCPVAAARTASLPEVLGDAALYFDPTSVDGLVAVLRRLLEDEALRQRTRAAGAARASGFRWATAAATLRHVLEERP